MQQQDLPFRPRGGKRPGAGRPRKAAGRSPHERRPELSARVPVHVSLRVVKEAGRLRNRVGFRIVRRAIAAVIARADFRIVHASIQGNHLHLIVEAGGKRGLSNGLRAFMISAARQINQVRGRRGQVFATRYHAVQLRTPRQVRNGLCYVINNWRRHGEDRAGVGQRAALVDPYSTGILFDGWEGGRMFASPRDYEPLPVAGASTWLLTVGWRRHAAIGFREVPGPRR